MKPEEVWKLWTFLSIVLRLGLDLDEWFRCHSLSPGKAPFSSVMDCWRQWVVGKPGFEPSLWVRPRESNLSQEHRISNYWVSLSFVLRQLDIFHGMQNGCCVWWFEDKMVVRGTLKAVSGLIPTGRESDCGSPVFQVDIHVIRLQDKKEQESFLLWI